MASAVRKQRTRDPTSRSTPPCARTRRLRRGVLRRRPQRPSRSATRGSGPERNCLPRRLHPPAGLRTRHKERQVPQTRGPTGLDEATLPGAAPAVNWLPGWPHRRPAHASHSRSPPGGAATASSTLRPGAAPRLRRLEHRPSSARCPPLAHGIFPQPALAAVYRCLRVKTRLDADVGC
jgi:hypothetical protein